MAPVVNPSETIELLRRHGLSLSKRLGQHFLIDGNVLRSIISAADIEKGEEILEVGPGIGTLTEALLDAGAMVTAIEFDHRLHRVLDIEFASAIAEGSLSVVAADAMKVMGPDDIGGVKPAKLIANLPYNIAAPLMVEYWKRFPSLQKMVVMVQKEAADRVLATPGTKAYAALTVKLRYQCEGGRVAGVARNSFIPPPRVDSAVIELNRRVIEDKAPAGPDLAALVDASFSSRRKTMRNNLSSGRAEQLLGVRIEKDGLMRAFEAAGITGQERAETLELETFMELRDTLGQLDYVWGGE